ncbi:MAG: hypothetical protein HDR00_11095 [Lachnospiraceae bacterium]|nr:hypothetical protein [Lachnospiraceae bacterium]
MKGKKAILIIFVIVILNAVLTACGYTAISAKVIQIELGEELSMNVLDYVNVKPELTEKIQNRAELDISEVDTMCVGEYNVKVKYKGDEIVIPVSVVDTTPPTVLPKKVEFKSGDRVFADDLVEVVDFSDVTLSILSRYDNEKELDFVILKQGQTIKLKAVDVYGNETFVEITPEITEVREEENIDRSYDSFLDFPYTEMGFANDDAYEFIKNAYASVNWYTEYELGDLTQYDIYKEKYKEFLNNSTPFLNQEAGREMYINDFSSIKIYDGKTFLYDKDFYDYYYFDMDKDGAPELCISGGDFISIFKYDINQEKILLWKQIEPSYYSLNGSGAIRWENGSGNVFYSLDENGAEVCSVFFMIRGTYNEESEQSETVYLVSLPKYAEELKNEYEENIICQGYYDKGQSVYYFRVTESQYDELTEDYYQAVETATQELKSVTYSYEELFEK